MAFACAVATLVVGPQAVAFASTDRKPANAMPTVTLIVKLRSGVATIHGSAFRAMDARAASAIAPQTYVMQVRAMNADAAARSLAHQPGVVYAEPNRVFRASDVAPNDPCYANCVYGSQWYLAADHAGRAWDVTKGSAHVVVAVLDTVVRNHPDLAGKLIRGPDFSDDVDPCGDGIDVDHGTHVAGIIGARTGNAAGIAGLGWNTEILSVGVLDPRGCGSTISIVRGLRYAVAHHARVINMSLGGHDPSDAVEDAIRDAQRAGVVVVAAAGNDGSTTPQYPAAYSGVLSVAATDRNGRIASFSNRGSWVQIAAPGQGILSTGAIEGVGTYSTLDGTSFSAPQVSASAALLMAANPCMSAVDIATRLEATAHRIAGVRSGVLDTGRAVSPPARGYRIAASDGGVFTRGGECYFGSAGSLPLRSPVVGMASTRRDGGYWLVAADGGVFSYGDARFHGSAATLPLQKPIVAMQSTPSSNGYWLVASDGGVFAYGDAHFYGSTGNIRLRKPVLGMAVTPTGHGYWLVASDGGIFAFGDAHFFGSTGALTLASPVHGIAASPRGNGYLLVGGDGGVFAFGGAKYRGSAARNGGPNATAIALTRTGHGYWILHSDGSTHAFGDASPWAKVPARSAVAIVAARTG
jgi:hypothetical protein